MCLEKLVTGKSINLSELHIRPDSRYIAYKLSKNPNPNDKRIAYVQDRVQTARIDFYGKRLNGWRFDKADMPIVRHITKGYKKKTNRSSKKKKKR